MSVFLVICCMCQRAKFNFVSKIHKSKGNNNLWYDNQFLKINFFVMSWTAFSLLIGAGNPDVSANVFSSFALIKSMSLVLKPVLSLRCCWWRR